jgi:hypothetical protein
MTLTLRNERLSVDIGEPGTVYTGPRFDWTGWVRQVTLDGAYRFCAPESLTEGEGTGGEGLCNEFGLLLPLGFDEAAPGGRFPKLGAGLLLKRAADRTYSHAEPYDIAPYAMSFAQEGEREAVFRVEPSACLGYAAALERRIRLDGNRMSIRCRLHNVGAKPIHTHEYCHNFLAVNGLPLGPDYELQFAEPLAGEEAGPLRWLDRSRFTLDDEPSTPIYFRREGPFRPGLQWTLRHRVSTAAVSEAVDFAPALIAVWGVAHVISPEVFFEFTVLPGESVEWERRFAFSVNGGGKVSG